MIPVILSGGSGTRLWPISRAKLPKQFCQIFEQSLHSMTLNRLNHLSTPWVITNESLKDLTLKNLTDLNLPTDQVILEPTSKNTAPAVALLCHLLKLRGQEEQIVGIFPADHLIENENKFFAALNLATQEATDNKIVTLGIEPLHPATGYGYIQTQPQFSKNQGEFHSYSVLKFHEKPDAKTAKSFISQGSHFWNAGIFVFKVDSMISAFEKHQPDIWSKIKNVKSDLSNLKEIYNIVDNISIDYAILEKLSPNELSCVPCDIGWNDVGSWDAIADILGNSSDKKVEAEAHGNFVHGLPDRTYAFAGVDDLIVIDTRDAILITKKEASQYVKDIVDLLKLKKPHIIKDHMFEDRPWGRFEVLKDTPAFKSKVIQINPNQQISYQSHSKREEHWLITQGRGEVILDEKIIPVSPGTYVKIPLGAKHRIRNPNLETIEFVEVQMGSYFGEDDIVRYQDDYNRS